MADNLTTTTTVATVPASTVIATDDAGSAHYQKVKLVDGTADSTTVIPGSATGLYVQGAVADDAVASGNPLRIGAIAKAFDGTDPGSVAEADSVSLVADLNRRLLVNTVHPNYWSVNSNTSIAQTNTELKGTPGGSLSLFIQSAVLSTDTAMNMQFVESTGGSTAIVAGPYYFAANGGLAFKFEPALKITAATNLGYTSSAAGNHTVTITGFTGP